MSVEERKGDRRVMERMEGIEKPRKSSLEGEKTNHPKQQNCDGGNEGGTIVSSSILLDGIGAFSPRTRIHGAGVSS